MTLVTELLVFLFNAECAASKTNSTHISMVVLPDGLGIAKIYCKRNKIHNIFSFPIKFHISIFPYRFYNSQTISKMKN